MRILEWEAFLEEGLPVGDGFAAMSVGVFDGVHRGHKILIERILNQNQCLLPVIITFRQNHKNSSSAYLGNITSFRQKTAIFESMGVAVTVVADLSQSFRRLSGKEFFRLLWERGKMGFLAAGNNFRCGHDLDTDSSKIYKIHADQGIPCNIVETITEDGVPISSNRIREAIHHGKLREAESMLGRPFILDITGTEFVQPENPNDDMVYHTARLDSVLPPPGKYNVLLHEENCGSKQIEIQIEKALIRIPHVFFCEKKTWLEFIC